MFKNISNSSGTEVKKETKKGIQVFKKNSRTKNPSKGY